VHIIIALNNACIGLLNNIYGRNPVNKNIKAFKMLTAHKSLILSFLVHFMKNPYR